MRIVHFSDVHIGVENYGQIDPNTGLSTRLVDFLSTLDEVVNYAINERVDLALFCGDAYKSRDPSQTHQREFAKRIARLSSEKIPVFLLMGNHDIPHVPSRATSLEIFDTLNVPNVYTCDTLNTYLIPTASGPIQIVGLPWIRRSVFLARKEARGLTPEQINESIQRNLTELIRVKAELSDPKIPTILAGHVSISQAKTGSEQSMMLGNDHVLLNSAVALPQFDYIALGHIHRHQILGQSPYVVYSGSLQRVDFGEEKDDKGFCIIDIDPNSTVGNRVKNFEFQKVKARNFLTIKIVIPPEDENPTETVVNSISKYHIEESIVRVLITIPGNLEGNLREADIRDALKNAHYIASISKEIIEQTQARLGEQTPNGLEPREALKIYLEGRDLSIERTEKLIRRADRLMRELGPN